MPEPDILLQPHPVIMLPFAFMLLAIAFLPFVLRHHWERHYHLVAIALALVTIVYYTLVLRNPQRMLHEAADYFSFIALVGSLFVVAGGIHIGVKGHATPARNCALLLCGGLLANVVGTTGASVLLIRPWMRLNRRRYTEMHTAFFIFVVGNVGGGLTPIGDPPLLLGYLKGVPFWWVLTHCWPAWCIAMGCLLLVFYALDVRQRRPPALLSEDTPAEAEVIRFRGRRNLWLLALILVAVFVNDPPFVRELLMLIAAAASYRITPKAVHQANAFSLAPVREIAWLFFGIFATMVPVLDYMALHAASLPISTPEQFFWLTGALSSVLDNAPTYLTLLANALGQQGLSIENSADVAAFLARGAASLAAISMGAVLFGAVTYIGNGPNFLVKSIVQQNRLPTPGFFMYLFKYSLPVFVPVLGLVWFLTFR